MAPDKIPRPPNSFILYRSKEEVMLRARAKALYGKDKLKCSEISKAAGFSWADEPKEVKDHYARLAHIAAVEHKLKYPDYKYTPGPRKSRARGTKLTKSRARKAMVTEGNPGQTSSTSTRSTLIPTSSSPDVTPTRDLSPPHNHSASPPSTPSSSTATHPLSSLSSTLGTTINHQATPPVHPPTYMNHLMHASMLAALAASTAMYQRARALANHNDPYVQGFRPSQPVPALALQGYVYHATPQVQQNLPTGSCMMGMQAHGDAIYATNAIPYQVNYATDGGYTPSPLVNTGVPSGMRLNVPVPEDCPWFAPLASQSTPTHPSAPSTGMSFHPPAIQSFARNTTSDLALSQSAPPCDFAPTTTPQIVSTSHQETTLLEPSANVPTSSAYSSDMNSHHENGDERMEFTSTGSDPVPPCANIDLSPDALLREFLQSQSQISLRQPEPLGMPTPGDVQVQESLQDLAPDHVWPSELDQWFSFDESAEASSSANAYN